MNPKPSASAGGNQSICSGNSTILGNASVTGNTYAWTSNPSGFTSTLAQPTVSPSATTTYYLTVYSTNNCSATDNAVITVNPLPAANAGSARGICAGSSTTLGAASVTGSTYAWTSTPTGFTSTVSNPTVSPAATTTYTLTERNSNGCTATSTVVVTVNPVPSPNAGTDVTICSGSSSTIGCPSGCPPVTGNTYAWTSNPSGYSSTLTNPTVTPSVTTTYYLTESSAAGCSGTDDIVITVTPTPMPNAGTGATICEGGSTTIGMASTAGHTYSWTSTPSGFTSTVSNPTVSPITTTTYTVTEFNAGCSGSNSVIINVNPKPIADAGADKTICYGQSVLIGGSSTTSNVYYSWTSAPSGYTSTSMTPTVSPTATTSYYLTVGNIYTGCVAMDTAKVSVNPLAVETAGSNRNINYGASTTLGGASSTTGNTYAWTSNPSGFTSTVYHPVVSPIVTTTYYLTATTPSGCAKMDSVIVTINPRPIACTGSASTICASDSVRLGCAAVTGNTYAWSSNPSGFTSTVSNPYVKPVVTTTYTLTETITATGSSRTNTVVITVNPKPIANAGGAKAVCAGSSTAIGSASVSGTTYAWTSRPSGYTSTVSNPTVTPSVTTTYFLTATSAAGCRATDSAVVTVNPLPLASTGPARTICAGSSTTIGCPTSTSSTYSWTSNPSGFTSTNSNPSVSPSVTTTYTFTETYPATGCSYSSTVVVTVNPRPTPNAGANRAICAGTTTSIGMTSTTGHTYSWTSTPSGYTSTVSNPSVTPTVTTTYTVTETITATGCSQSSYVIVTVNPNPVANAGGNKSICAGASTTLGSAAVTGLNYYWSTTPSGFTSTMAQITVSPSATTTYTLLVSNGTTTCYSRDNSIVTVNPLPTPKAYSTATTAICAGQSITLGSGTQSGNTYAWTSDPSGFTSTVFNVTVTPSASTRYKLKVTNTNGCSDTSSVYVKVNALPTGNAGPDQLLTCGQDTTSLHAMNIHAGENVLWTGFGVNYTNGTSTVVHLSGLKKGLFGYRLTTSNATTGCSVSDSVYIRANCPGHYQTQIYCSTDTLKNGYVISTLSDPDTTVTHVSLASGYTLPAGVGYNTTNGSIYVTNNSLLVSGIYSLLFNETDALGGTSSVAFTLTICTDQEATHNNPPNKNQDCYRKNDVVVSFTDADCAIEHASITTGSLPTGFYLNPVTGSITVRDTTLITAGVKSFTVKTVDCHGGISYSPITWTIYADKEAVYTVAPAKASGATYVDGETLASVTDADGIITNAMIISGTLPSGMAFNTSTGEFTVSDFSKLRTGNYSLVVLTFDITCGFTKSPVNFMLDNPLPVELISFEASMKANNVAHLTWSTATEINNKQFDIERSFDGTTFEKIGEKAGHNNSVVVNNYSYDDQLGANPLANIIYYRLNQIDWNGQHEYTDIRKVIIVRKAGEVKMWYNRDANVIRTTLSATHEEQIAFIITDMAGNIISEESRRLSKGPNAVEVTMPEVRAGMYNVLMSLNGEIYQVRIMKY